MFRAGADGYTTKVQPTEQIVDAMSRVLRADRYLPPELDACEINKLMRDEAEWPLERLTTREREVFDFLVRGDSNVRIAMKLCISPRTSRTRSRRRSAELDAKQIQVEVQGSKAILKRTVRSWAERQEAERAAWVAPGITQVEDHIQVSYASELREREQHDECEGADQIIGAICAARRVRRFSRSARSSS